MSALRARDMLALWEAGRPLHTVDRALLLLATACPLQARDVLAKLPLGERDARLLALREEVFGDHLDASASCPRCGEVAEFGLSCSALRSGAGPAQPRRVEEAGYRIAVRALDSSDLAAAAACDDVAVARRTLMTRCVTTACRGDGPVPVEDLPEALCDAIGAAALAADPGAERLLDVTCPRCDLGWQLVLEPAEVLWREIAARAHRLLLEVHLLATAYGWSETEILALGDARRAAYLQMVSA